MLLAAASELTYHTVNCSALNAEELNREQGFIVSTTYILLYACCQGWKKTVLFVLNIFFIAILKDRFVFNSN